MITVLIYRFLESYFRHRWLYLLPIVIMAAAGGFYFANLKPKYHASGIIYVQTESYLAALNSVTPSDNSWWSTPAQIVIGNMNELIRTDAYIRAVIHATDLEKNMDKGSEVVSEIIVDVRESIWIEPLGDNQIRINASNEDPSIAFQITNSVLTNFVQYQVNAQRVEGEAAQAFFAELIQTYKAELDTARENFKAYLLANPPPLRGDRPELEQLEINRLQGDIQTASQRYQSVLEKEENARLALAQIEEDTRQSYRIIDAPVLPEKPSVSRKELAIQGALFLAAGVILFVIAVAGSLIFDRSFRLPIDVKYGIHLPVLAMIPDTTVSYSLFQRIKRRFWRKKENATQAAQETTIPPDAQNETEVEIVMKPSRNKSIKQLSTREEESSKQERDGIPIHLDEDIAGTVDSEIVDEMIEIIRKRGIHTGKLRGRKPSHINNEENGIASDDEVDVSTTEEDREPALNENEQDGAGKKENIQDPVKSKRSRSKKAASRFSPHSKDIQDAGSNGKTGKSDVENDKAKAENDAP